MNTNPEWLLLYAGLLAIVTETVFGFRTGYDLVIAGAALVMGGAVGAALDNWPTGLSVALVVMVFYVLLWRRNVRKVMLGQENTKAETEPVVLPPPPAAAVIEQSPVTEAIVEPPIKTEHPKRTVRKSRLPVKKPSAKGKTGALAGKRKKSTSGR